MDITCMLDVRRVKNHFTAIGNCGIRLIHALSASPEVRVHFWNYRKHAAKWPVNPLDVRFRGVFGCQLPGIFRGTEINAADFWSFKYQGETGDRDRNLGGRQIDQLTDRSCARPNDVVAA